MKSTRRKIQIEFQRYKDSRHLERNSINYGLCFFIDNEYYDKTSIESGEHTVSIYYGPILRFDREDEFEERKAMGYKYPKFQIPSRRDDTRTLFIPNNANSVTIVYDITQPFFRSGLHGKIKEIVIK